MKTILGILLNLTLFIPHSAFAYDLFFPCSKSAKVAERKLKPGWKDVSLPKITVAQAANMDAALKQRIAIWKRHRIRVKPDMKSKNLMSMEINFQLCMIDTEK